MEGPDTSPASRIASAVGLSPSEKNDLTSILFSKNIETSAQLSRTLRSNFNIQKNDLDASMKEIWKSQQREGYAIEGSMDFLKMLAETGASLGIISNIWKPYFICFSTIFSEFMHLFKVRTLSYQVGFVKPDPGIFKAACSNFGLYDKIGNKFKNPQNVVMIGDSYHHDIKPAIRLNFKTIWIHGNRQRKMKVYREVEAGKLKSPDVVVDDIEKLARMDSREFLSLLFDRDSS